MAGHSKWANIKFRKERMDARKSKIFSRLVKEITVATRIGGSDPESNPRLRLALEKAKENNLPSNNVSRAIKRGNGEIEGSDYEEIRYEGYGPSGTAFIVDCTTDNRKRCVAEVRHVFSRFGGNLASTGAVAFNFEHCGLFLISASTDEERLTSLGVEHDVIDLDVNDDGSFAVKTTPDRFAAFKESLECAGISPDHAEVTMLPLNEVDLAPDEQKSATRLFDELDGLDDTDQIFTNASIGS